MKRFRMVVALISLVGAMATQGLALDQAVSASPGLLDGASGIHHADLNATFTWTELAGAEWYQVYVAEVGIPNPPAYAKWVQAPLTTQAIGNKTSLKAGTTYRWWVRAWSQAEGFGEWSATRTFQAESINQIYIPAHAFRVVNAFAGYSYEAGGCMLNPSTDNTQLIAAVPLHSTVTITSIELFWKNNVTASGASIAAVKIFGTITAATLDIMTVSGDLTASGIHSVASAPHFYYPSSSSMPPSISVHLTNRERWLMGVEVSYFETAD